MSGYDKEQLIRDGMFGKVWLVKSRLSRHSYILKEINFSSATESERQHALNEVIILSKCKHKHIIRYKEAVLDTPLRTLSIIMEYAEGGDLSSAITNQNGVLFTEHRVLSWFIQLCLALQYIHFQNILHRDLKTQNIFLTRSKVIKIGDFGVARVLGQTSELANTSIGTPYYISPEICQRKPYNFKSDIWALGCVLFEMAALDYAFAAMDFNHLLQLILSGTRGDLPKGTSDVIKDLVEALLKINPAERPSTEDILACHSLQPYLTEYMANQNSLGSFVPLLATQKEINQRCLNNVALKNLNHTKRSGSISISNPRPSKHRTDTQKKENEEKEKNIQAGQSSRGLFNKVIPRATPSFKYSNSPIHQKMKKFTTQDDSAVLNSQSTFSMKPSPLLKSSDAVYDLPQKFGECQINRSEIDSAADLDGGYLSLSSNLGKTYGSSMSGETSSQPKQSGENTGDSRRNPDPKSISGSESHTHCQHVQCHQCMLDMLWKNRIRLTENSSVNTDEYTKLKNKLLLVFEPNIFKKVYQSLINDWEKNENITKNSFLCLANSLNFEQVQSLPLMMQLIQLDILMKSR